MARKYEVNTHTGLRTSACCKNTAACLCICYFASKLSFVKVQNALVYSLADEIIDEEVFVLLFVNPQIQHIHAGSTKLFVSTRLIQVNI